MKRIIIFTLITFSFFLFSCNKFSDREKEEIKFKIINLYKDCPKMSNGNEFNPAFTDGSFNIKCRKEIKKDAQLNEFFTELLEGWEENGKQITIDNANFVGIPLRQNLIKILKFNEEETKIILSM